MSEPFLKITDLTKKFLITKGIILKKTLSEIRAVDGVSISIERGQTLALVGESGSGKTTIGKMILGIYEPTDGQIFLEGKDVTKLRGAELKEFRRKTAAIFQDPFSSLDPRMNALQIIEEPMRLHEKSDPKERIQRALDLLERVGLTRTDARKYPHQFSGGQRQRIAIARSLTLSPSLIVADEPISALDVSVQAKIINLLMDLQNEFKLTYLLISHDLSVVEHIADIIVVLYLGKIVEVGKPKGIFQNSRHPYTQLLLKSLPIPDPEIMRTKERTVIKGEIPSTTNIPPGCRFHTRCPYAKEICADTEPRIIEISKDHFASCHFREEIEPFKLEINKASNLPKNYHGKS